MKVKLADVRLSFPNHWEPKSIKGSAPKFSDSVIFAKDSPNVKLLQEAIVAVAKEKWKDKWQEVLTSLKAADKLCIHDGDSKAEYDGYKGNYFVNATSDTRPVVIDGNKNPLMPADGKPYSGCYVNLVIDVWAQSNEFGKRINAKLLGIQFVRDGERLAGGATGSADDFEEIKTDEGTPAKEASDLF